MRGRLIGAVFAVILGTVAAIALVTYVRGIEARVQAGEQTVEVLVVQEPVAQGTAADGLMSAVASQRVPRRLVAAGSITSLDQLAGQVATVGLQPGEQVLASRFAAPSEIAEEQPAELPSGLHRISVSLEPERVLGGLLAVGDTVAVFISLQEPGEEGAITTHLVLHKVPVTQVQGGTRYVVGDEDASGPPTPPGNVLVTLAASASQVEQIVFGAEHGSLWLSTEPADAPEVGTSVQSRETIYR